MSEHLPRDLQTGLEHQLDRLAELRAGGEVLAGWKVGLTSGGARDAMGVGFRPFGYLLESRIFESGVALALARRPGIGVENELCFTIARTPAGAFDRAAVAQAIATVAPAFEVVEQRLGGRAAAAERLADNLSQWGVVVGAPSVLDWQSFDFAALQVTLRRDGGVVEQVAAEGHIDDHLASIGALARTLSRFGLTLNPGDRVITGSYTRQPAGGPCRWQGDFGTALGGVELELT